MSLLIDNFNHISYTTGKKRVFYEYAYDTVNTCRLIVRCDATMQGPVTIDGDLNVTGTITGTLNINLDYSVSYNTVSFAIPTSLATTFDVYQIDTSSAPLTITLPAISSLDDNKKRNIYIVDVGGALTQNPLTVVTSGTDTISGDTAVEVVVNYTGLHLVSNANVAPGAAGKWLIT